MGSKSRLLLLALAAVLVILVFAVPAMAASNVTKGDSQLLVPKAKVTELQSKYTSINAMNEIVYKARWSSKSLSWWFDAPVWTKVINPGGAYTTYNVKTGKGTFYHSGQLVWVNAGAAAQKGYKWQGIRIVATGKNSYYVYATTGNTAPYTPNHIVAQSTATTKITHSGKKYHIDGIKFKLATAAQNELKTALGQTFLTTNLLFDGDLYFTMK
jgi:hypothetical protein